VKKYLPFFLAFLLILSFSAVSVSAQQTSEGSASVDTSSDQGVSSEMILPPSPGGEPGFLGQDHGYSVVFRGNGEAVVSARIAFTNTSDNAVDKVTLRIPKVEPREVSAYQIIVKGRCIRYGQTTTSQGIAYQNQTCLEYSEPDYYQGYYGNSQYQKAKYELDLDTLTITLPQKVAANKQGAYFVYFRANGYTKKDVFGAFNYTFETMKTDATIRNLRVGIATDSDLFLKGASSEVNYRFNDTAAVAEFGKAGVSEPVANATFDSYINQIGSGTLVKTASNLAPLESFTVDGAYAGSRAKLYGNQIAIVAAVLIVFLLLAAVVVRFVYKRLAAGKDGVEGKDKPMPHNSSNLLVIVGVSFLSSFLITAYTTLLFVGTNILSSVVSYRYDAVMAIFVAIISFGVYTVLLFGPAVYFGFKKGVGWGIGMLVAIIIWLMFFMGIGLLALLLFQPTGGYPGPVLPLLESSGV
jgi:hypothetical protein